MTFWQTVAAVALGVYGPAAALSALGLLVLALARLWRFLGGE